MAGNAVAREALFALRETIARIEGKVLPADATCVGSKAEKPFAARPKPGEEPSSRFLPLGVPAFDAVLQGGLPLGELMEFRGAELRDAGAVTGFALGLCVLLHRHFAKVTGRPLVLWIGEKVVAMEAGLPLVQGLQDFGLPASHLLYAAPKGIDEALWLAEAGLESRAFSAVLLEVRGNPARFGLTESRRLSLKARAVGCSLLLLRQAGEEEASSAVFRLRIGPAPAVSRRLADGSVLPWSLGNPAFHLAFEKSRQPALADFFLEWNPHDRQFSALPLPAAAAGEKPQPAHSGALLSASGDRPHRPQPLGHVVALHRAS